MSKSSKDCTEQSSDKHLIRFFFEDLEEKPILFATLENGLIACSRKEALPIKSINVIFCSDRYLSGLNVKYLNHEDLTDVITFPLASNPIEGEIYISWERVIENAFHYSDNNLTKELNRVVLHGFLHLCGYSDKSEPDKTRMRNKEDQYLNEFPRIHF